MSTVNPLAFQYQLRAFTLSQLGGEDRMLADESRDRELEDFLGDLDNRTTRVAVALTNLQAGIDTITLTSASTGYVDVAFVGAFGAAPVVVAVGNDPDFNISISNRTTTGVRITARHVDGTAVTRSVAVNWIAKN